MFGRKRPQTNTAPSTPAVTPNASPSDLLENAATYVAMITGAGKSMFRVRELKEANLCTSGSNLEGVCFIFDGDENICGKMYFFPQFASVWPDGEASPRPEIPTAMIVNRIPGYEEALRLLFMTVPRGVDRIAYVSH